MFADSAGNLNGVDDDSEMKINGLIDKSECIIMGEFW